MLQYYEKNTDGDGLIQTVGSDKPKVQYIFSDGLVRKDAKALENDLGLAGHLLSDVFDADELPRVDQDNGTKYVFLRAAELKNGKLQSHPMLFITGADYFACLSVDKDTTSLILEPMKDLPVGSPDHVRNLGMNIVAKKYELLIDEIGGQINRIEKRMRSHEVTNDDFYKFVSIENSLGRLRTILVGLQTVAERLMDTAKNEADRQLLDDIRLFSKQLLVEAESCLQSIGSIRNAYSTIANNTLNQRMKLLTSLTLLLALPNVFYSMYGMNVPLPFMRESWAYFGIVGFTVIMMIIIFMIARQRRLF